MSLDPRTRPEPLAAHNGPPPDPASDPVSDQASDPVLIADDTPTAEPRDLLARVEKLSRRNSFRIGLTIGTLVTVATGLLIIQNGHTVRLHWATTTFDAPLWIFLALTLAAGLVLGQVVPFALRRGRQRARERRTALKEARDALDRQP